MREKATKLYSYLSKGIHSELVIKSDINYDKTTVLEKVNETVKFCGLLSLVSHNIDSAICCLDLTTAIECYKRIKERTDNYGNGIL